MRIRILGPLEVAEDDSRVDIGGPRQQCVLACLLAVEPDYITVDGLIDEVWGDRAPTTATHIISTYVSSLRKVLGSRIISDGKHHRIDTTPDDVDAAMFSKFLDSGRSLLDSDPEAALSHLDAAIEMWHGGPFGNLPDDSHLLQRSADRLTEIHLQAIEARFDARLDLGEHAQMIPDVSVLTREHPLREGLWRQLMLALYRSGRQAEALRAGNDLHNILCDELGIDPSPAIRDLEERILLQDPGLDRLPPTNLPTFVSSFIGRSQELDEVVKLLQTDRLVTLVGVGGVGKTRMAARVGRMLLDRFSDGVWWVDFASIVPGTALVGKVADVLGLADQPGTDPIALLSRYLVRRQALLIFDNCEHVADRTALLSTALLEAAPSLTILVTSRRPLLASGETRFEVPPLSVPGEELGLSDAERLFYERATQVERSFIATPSNATDVARVCSDLEGLPLAIEMAAARVNLLTPVQIADRLDDRFRLLGSSAGEASWRHASLAATFDWSYDLLTANQQALFDRLSVFAGTFDVRDCEAVATGSDTSWIVSDLGALVDASMVSAVPTEDQMRYRLLDTLQIYGRDRLDARGESYATAERHSCYFLGLAQAWDRVHITPQYGAAATALTRSDDELLAALDWSLDNEPRSVTLAAALGLSLYWFRRGDPGAAHTYGSRMLEHADDAASNLRAAALLCLAFGIQLSGDFARATSRMDDAMALLHDSDDWRTLLWGLNAYGQGASLAGNPRGATKAGTQILELCAEHDVTLPRAYGLALLGEGEFFGDGDLDLAREYLEEAVTLFRALGDDSALNIFGLGLLAGVAGAQGDYEAAERHAIEATTLGGPSWSAAAFIILSTSALSPMGELDRAERAAARGLIMAHDRSMEFWIRAALLTLGGIAAGRGQWERAARLHGASRHFLPPWMHEEWTITGTSIRRSLGDAEYERFAAAAAAEDLDRIVQWATAEGPHAA